MALTKTASVAGQTLLFDTVLVTVPTTTNNAGATAQPETTTTTNLTSGYVAHNPRIRVVVTPKQPSPAVQGQPADSWAFPSADLMTGSGGQLSTSYFKFTRRLVDGSAQDPYSAFGLKVVSTQLLNFNTATGQPTSTPGAVQLELVLGVTDAASGALVADLESSRGYDFDMAPELLFEWYKF